MDWPADRVERRPIDTLVPYAQNARTHSPSQVEQIAASMREWGWTNPALIDETGGIIAGHGRILAGKMLGFTEAPVMVAEGWTEAQRRAYALADNQLALNAGWDSDLLMSELAALHEGGFDLDLLGFPNLDALLATGGGQTDPDDVPEPPANPVAVLGDVWLMGRHRLVCGDSTSADWREAWALFPGDVAYVWHAGNMANTVADSLIACGLHIRAQIIWAKNQLVIGRGDYHPQHEPLWYAVRKNATGHWSGDRKQTTLWQIDKPVKSETGHSTQKPVECMKRPIENNSSPGQAVYDPFSGSFTTGIAAEMTGRACHAIELNPAYVDVSVQRWQDFTGKTATLEETGQTFAEVTAERLGEEAHA